MRLVAKFINQNAEAEQFSQYLKSQHILNQLEIHVNRDWGSEEYGNAVATVWIIEEDDLEKALQLYDAFNKDPLNPKFKSPALPPPPPPPPKISSEIRKKIIPKMKKSESFGTITGFLFFLCCALLFIDQYTSPTIQEIPTNLTVPYTPIFSSPLKKAFLYDYPKAFSIVDQLVNLFGLPALSDPNLLPTEGKALYREFLRTPYWDGFYPILLEKLQKNTPIAFPAPLFEKIRGGELWRILTPCILHADIFHLLFNMLWLLVLGKQIEERLGKWRYLSFLVIAGAFSNTCQYLMSGPNFIGFSGILCAMLTFIWERKKVAPWEGYNLQKTTMAFIAIFILAMFAIQIVSFLTEVFFQTSIAPGIANTAHLTGATIGFVLGHLNFFSWKHNS